MPNSTCSELGCHEPIQGRGLCARHYGFHYRRGTLPERAAFTEPHSLSDIDTETSTAICALCGPTRIRLRHHRNECMTAHKRGRLKAKYGITNQDYDQMATSQGGLCAICMSPPTLGGKLVVDHDHVTGAVRQLLCGHCNVALGFLRDSPTVALAASKYLLAHR